MSESNPILEFIKPSVRAAPSIGVYKVDAYAHPLQWNENPFDLPDALKADVLERLARRSWSRYPGFRPYSLIERLADVHGVDAGQVVVANGSSEIIRAALNAVLDAGDPIVLPSPTFGLYRNQSRMAGAEILSVSLSAQEHFALPVDEIIVSARTNQAKMVVVCAPNNPTGTVYAADDLRRIAAECGCLFLVDEAYGQFCGQDLKFLVDEFDNVILARTFSKAFAMAGVRVGYALTSAPIANQLQKLVNTFTLSIFSEAVTLAVLDNPAYEAEHTQLLIRERERLAAALNDLPGLYVFPSGANFLLVKLEQPTAPLVAHLREHHSILISDTSSYPALQDTVRISVGAPEQNDLLVRAVAAFLSEHRVSRPRNVSRKT